MNLAIPAHVRRQAVPAAMDAAATLVPVLKQYRKTRRAVAVILAAQTVYKAATALRERFQEVKETASWTVTVSGDDSLYEHALALLASKREQNWHAVEAELGFDYEEDEDGDRLQEVPCVNARPAERAEASFFLDGHDIYGYVDTFAAARRQQTASVPSLPGQLRTPTVFASPQVVFVASSEAGQAAVLEALKATAAASQTKTRRRHKPQLFVTSNGWGAGWDRKGDLQARPVESVAVTDGQVQGVVDDILRFRELEPEYVRRGVPFHRGYLLFGPPGTGKTSAVKAIAHATESDLYIANLGTLNDAGLAELVSGVSRSRNRAILVLEDIDSFGAALQRDEEDDGDDTGAVAGISTTGLLNALDGIETPHGLVTIMTSNHPERLDAALVRPGRVDRQVFFGYPDDPTVERHFTYFFGRKPSVPLYAAGRSGAELNEVFIQHMTDPEGAEKALSHRVRVAA